MMDVGNFENQINFTKLKNVEIYSKIEHIFCNEKNQLKHATKK